MTALCILPSLLHSQLEHLDRSARLQYSLEILQLFKQITRIWDRKKHLETHGTLPDEATEPAATAKDLEAPAEMVKQINRLRVNISKHKNNPAKAEKVAQWIEQKQELEKKLNDATE